MNRPAQKLSDQLTQAEVASNFDILHQQEFMHVERFIGRVREWSILNAVWPVQRMDLLSSTWQALCHIVNLADNASYWPKRKQMKEELMVNKKKLASLLNSLLLITNYSRSRKTVNTRENFWNVYCFVTNEKRDETAKDNRQTAA